MSTSSTSTPKSPKVEAWSQSRFAPSQDPTQFSLNSSSSPSTDGGTDSIIPSTSSSHSISITQEEYSFQEEQDSIPLDDLRSLYSRPTLGPGVVTLTPPQSSKSTYRPAIGLGTPQTPISQPSTQSNDNASPSNQASTLRTPPLITSNRFGYGGHNRLASLSGNNPSNSAPNSPLNPSASTSNTNLNLLNNTGRQRTVSSSSNQTFHSSTAASPTPAPRAQRRSYVHAAQASQSYPAVRVLPLEEKRRILVTGGAGFVGSHLVDRLLLMGHDVIVIDNFFTGSKTSLSSWIGHPSFDLVRHDVVNAILLEVDQVYHLACPASPIHYQANQIKTIKTNFLGTLNLLGLAKRTKARFLLASTSEVYGDPAVHPQPESYNGNVNPTGPRACYDEGKRVAETLTYGYLYQDDVDVRVARIFNSYGPRMHPQDGRVVSNFVVQALKGEALTIYGDGSQTRSFMFVHDLITGLIALMNREPQFDEELGRFDDVHSPVNLGNPIEFTIKELVDIVSEVVEEVRKEAFEKLKGDGEVETETEAEGGVDGEGSGRESVKVPPPVRVEYLPMPVDDPKQRRPDTTRAKQLLGWEPRWKLRDGLREMVKYYRMRIEEGSL